MIGEFHLNYFFNSIIMDKCKIDFVLLFCSQVFKRIIFSLIVDFSKYVLEKARRNKIFKSNSLAPFDKSCIKKIDFRFFKQATRNII